MPRRRITREKLTGGLLVAAAIAVMNVTTYGLTLAAARLLGPDQFGQFSSLLGVLIVVNVVSLALQATGARRVATSEQSRPELEHRILSATRMAAAAVLVIGLLLAPVLNQVLRLDSIWGAIAMAVAAALLCIMGGQAGILQGEQRWSSLALVYAAMGIGRLAFGLLALGVHRSAAAALIGVAVAAIAPVVVGVWALAHPQRTIGRAPVGAEPPSAWMPWERGSILREIMHSSHALFAFFALSNVDVLIARALLPAHEAGLYSSGLVLTKAVLFLPQFVVIVLFPSMARSQGGRRLHVLGLATVLGVGVAASSGVALLSGLAQEFVGGTAYAEVRPLLWVFALLGTVLAMIQLLVYGALAGRHPRAVLVLWAGLVATVAAATMVDTVAELLVLKLGIDVAVLVVLAVILIVLPAPAGEPSADLPTPLAEDVSSPEQPGVR